MYRTMYHLLFNAITDALRQLERGETSAAAETLRLAQRRAEEVYLESQEE